MANIIDYINEYGEMDFSELEFNELDALIFSQLVYIDYSNEVGDAYDEVRISLKEVNSEYRHNHTAEEIEKEISIVNRAIQLLELCAETKRFSEVKLTRFINNVDSQIDKQFSAVNFHIGDDIAVIAYKGTDTSITGVREAAMLSYMFPVPAQIEGLYYLQETAMRSGRNIIVCGHSKGGNLATFAAVNCSNSLKKKLIAVYEFDAPGFPNEFLERYDFTEIKDKIHSYIPQTSIIGCVLNHSDTLKIVKSVNANLKQHRVDSWETDGTSFVFESETDEVSKFIKGYLNGLIEELSDDELEDFFYSFFKTFEDSGINDYDSLKQMDVSHMFKLFSSYKGIDPEKRAGFMLALKSMFKDFQALLIKEKITSKLKKDKAPDELEEETETQNTE